MDLVPARVDYSKLGVLSQPFGMQFEDAHRKKRSFTPQGQVCLAEFREKK